MLKERRRGGSAGGSRVKESTLSVSASLLDRREMVGCGAGVRLGARESPETGRTGLVNPAQASPYLWRSGVLHTCTNIYSY